MEAALKFLCILGLVVVLGSVGVIEKVEGAGECGKSTTPDNEALKLAPCASAAQDENASVPQSCCAQVKKIGKNPSCLCAVLLSDTAKASGVNLQIALTIPKRCNFANRPVGYKCGRFQMETSAVSDSSSVPVLLPFFSVFLLSYLIAYFIVFRNWSPKIRPEASSCFISLLHGTPAVFLACFAILNDSNRGFDGLNTTFQKMVLDYSIAYFLMDLLHYIVFFPSDVLFIAHHLATLFVICTCRYVVSHGAFAILFLLILAEVTSLCQNVWTLAGARKNDVQIAAKVYDFLSPPFYTLYSLVRGFGGPYFIYRMLAFYTSGLVDGLIPKWVWISWVAVVLTAIGVSIMWISNLWMELYRERTRKLEEKTR